MQDRVPPQNIEAEQSVLGAMLIEKEAIPKVMEILRDTDFTVRRTASFLTLCWSFTIRTKLWI